MATENETALVKRQAKKPRRWLRRLITFLIIVVVVVVGFVLVTTVLFPPKAQTVQDVYTAASAGRGTLEVKVQGTGNISSANTYDIISSQPGKIERLDFEQGNIVEEGALLYEISNKDLEDTISRAENDLKQSQINSQKQKNTLPNYYVDAPATGIIKQMKARVGEDAANTSKAYGALCYISKERKMRVTITVTTKTTYAVGPTPQPTAAATPSTASSVTSSMSDNIVELRPGDWVYLLIGKDTSPAKVVSTGGNTFVAELETDIYEIGQKAEAYEYRGLGLKMGEGKLELVDPVAVTGTGIITGINVTEGQYINRGERMFEMDTRDYSLTLESQSLTRQLTREQIDENIEKLNDNKMHIPHGGVLATLNVKVGQSITGGMLIGTIVDYKDQEITLDVDELDIPKIQAGQAVDIRVDALPDDSFTGSVVKIGELGTTTGGMTSYPVTISLQYDAKVRIGMSASADILVASRENVLMVPLEAVNEANGQKFVMVLVGGESSLSLPLPTAGNAQGARNFARQQAASATNGTPSQGQGPGAGSATRAQPGAGTGSNGQAYAEIAIRPVTVGLTNESYAEILDGLREGETVLLPKSTSSGNPMMMMFGGAGGQRQGAAPAQGQRTTQSQGNATQRTGG